MNIAPIGPNTYSEFIVKSSGYPATVHITFNADEPLCYYFMSEKDYRKYEKEKKYKYLRRSDGVYEADLTLTLPYSGKWYFIIINRNKNPVTPSLNIRFVR